MKTMALAGAVALALTMGACTESARTDASIAAEVKDDLAEKAVPGTITVAVTDGVVTLAGMVPDTKAKEKAEDVAEDVDGVDRVVNQLSPSMAGDAPAALPHNE